MEERRAQRGLIIEKWWMWRRRRRRQVGMKILRRRSAILLHGVKRFSSLFSSNQTFSALLPLCFLIDDWSYFFLFHSCIASSFMGFCNLQEDDILREQISIHGTEKYDYWLFDALLLSFLCLSLFLSMPDWFIDSEIESFISDLSFVVGLSLHQNSKTRPQGSAEEG